MADFNFKGAKLTREGQKYVDALNKLQKLEVGCGFQAGEDAYEDETQVVDVAAYNELGTSTIPPRPFMAQSWEKHEDELNAMCRQAVEAVANGEDVKKALAQIGAYGVGLIQEEIREGEFVPNAPATIEAKGSDKPLIDTGHMRQSVHYVVREKED